MSRDIPTSTVTAVPNSTVSISNLPLIQPVSAVSLPLPTDASTETTLEEVNLKTPPLGQALPAASTPVVLPISQLTTLTPLTTVATTQSGNWTVIANTGLTQPLTDDQLRSASVNISASSLPLPSGASTSLKQDEINLKLDTLVSVDFVTQAALVNVSNLAHSDSLEIKTNTSNISNQLTSIIGPISDIALLTDSINNKTPELGQALDVASVPVVLTASQLSTLTPLSTVIANTGLAQPLTDTQLRASAITVNAVSLPLPTSAATEAKQDTQISSLVSVDSKLPVLGQALDTASVPVVLTASQIATLTPLTSVNLNGTLPAFGSTPTVNVGIMPTVAVTGNFYQSTQPVSLLSVPLATNAATDRVTAFAPYANRLSDGTSFYDARQIRALTSSDIVTVAASALPTGAATSDNQNTANTSLDTIAINTNNIATSVLQTSGNLSLTTIANNTVTPNIRPLTTATDSVTVGVLPGTIEADIAAIKINTAKISQFTFQLAQDSNGTVFLIKTDNVVGTSSTINVSTGAAFIPVGAIELTDPTGASELQLEPNEYEVITTNPGNWTIGDILTRVLIVNTANNTVSATIWQSAAGITLSVTPVIGVDVIDTDKQLLVALRSIDTKVPTNGQKTSANSIPVVIASDNAITISSLPVTAATSTLQSVGNASLVSIATNTPTLGQALASESTPVVLTASQITTLTPLSTVATTQSGSWNVTANTGLSQPLTDAQLRSADVPVSGTFYQATQPISAADLPLPSGAATASNQTTGNTSIASINTKTPALGQALAVASVPVVLTASQLSTLTPLSSVSLNGTLPAFTSTPTVNIGTSPTLAVTGTFFQTTQPVSLVSVPLATNAATDRTLAASPYAHRLSDGVSFYDARQIRNLTSADTVTVAALPVVSINSLPTGSNIIGSIANTSFGVSGTLPPFTSTPTFNVGTTNGLALDSTIINGNQVTQIKSGIKGASSSQLITSTASGANHQPLDVIIYDALGNPITSFGGGSATSTSTLQITGNNSLSSIDLKTPILGQGLETTSSPVVLPASQITLLTTPRTPKFTYTASFIASTISAAPTDIFTITGNAAKTVYITKITISATSTSSITVNVSLIKRSTLNTGGTSFTTSNIPYKSTNPASSSVVRQYTNNPTVGTLVGIIKTKKMFIGLNNSVVTPGIEFNFTDNHYLQLPELNGVNSSLNINLNGTGVANASFNYTVEWIEDV